MRIALIFLLASIFGAKAAAQSPQQEPINVMPMPANVQVGSGGLAIDGAFSVELEGAKDARLDRGAARFIANISRETGIPLSAAVAVHRGGEARLSRDVQKMVKKESRETGTAIRADIVPVGIATLTVYIQQAAKPVPELGEDEGYTLDVTPSRATLTATNTLGALHGLETFLQLVQSTPAGFAAPAVHIEDKPRFPWRGLMIDVSRHFIPIDVIKRNVDAMAAVKLNVLHLHLSDDQGFRVESKEFPKLQEMGSDGNYFTQAEIRDLVEYAADRGIRIVPEFDMPGHATSWFTGYPELSSGPGPYSIARTWGVFDAAMDPTREETYKFLERFIGEMSELFPDRFFHMGGDEVNGKQWDANPKIQAFMRAHGFKNNEALQQYFTDRVQKIVARRRKLTVGWDEILVPGMSKDIVIQSWRGQASLAEAAKQGYRGLLSSGYYLDSMAPAAQYYAVEPTSGDAASLSGDEKSRILGGEACAWAEFLTPENIDSRLWPRTAAIAERFWSPAETQDAEGMYRRLASVSWRLEWLRVTHKSSYVAMLGRMAGTDDVAALRVLGDAVRPVDLGTRQRTARAAGVPATSTMPLNRLVDAAPPESEAANDFTRAVNALAAANFKDAALEAQIRLQLTSWRDNDALLQPILARSALLNELAPVSQALGSLGAAGLQALDYLDKGEKAPDAWKTEALGMIDQAKKPQADLFIVVAPAVEMLVNASIGAAPPAAQAPAKP
ncbi:MAG TPA: family 20 glycosylhydrolase [Candidatus Acidoferrum sp.]|nr:family 20 glycosylhydrolase [Candidatus Acidoferrum sp.]